MCLCVLRDARELWLEQFAGASVVARSINDQWLRGATHARNASRYKTNAFFTHNYMGVVYLYSKKKKPFFTLALYVPGNSRPFMFININRIARVPAECE